jgi:hypothetical protein
MSHASGGMSATQGSNGYSHTSGGFGPSGPASPDNSTSGYWQDQQVQYQEQMTPMGQMYHQLVRPQTSQQPPPVVRNAAHMPSLDGRMQFIRLPAAGDGIAPPHGPPTGVKVFFGRTSFETVPHSLCALILQLSNVRPAATRAAGRGCFVTYMSCAADAEAVCRWHRRVLFDHDGVWVARDEQQLALLTAYLASASCRERCHRLPRDAMVVELQTEQPPPPPPPPHPAPARDQGAPAGGNPALRNLIMQRVNGAQM